MAVSEGMRKPWGQKALGPVLTWKSGSSSTVGDGFEKENRLSAVQLTKFCIQATRKLAFSCDFYEEIRRFLACSPFLKASFFGVRKDLGFRKGLPVFVIWTFFAQFSLSFVALQVV